MGWSTFDFLNYDFCLLFSDWVGYKEKKKKTEQKPQEAGVLS